MSLSRRQFIKASGVALCAGAAPLKAHAAGQQLALPVPPLLESRRGQPLFLTLQRSHWSFTPGTRAPVWGINGRYMGPTIRVWSGDDVKLIYSNRLTENVAMTIRGLQVPGPLIGGAYDVAERRLGAGAAYPPERCHLVVSGQHAEPDGEAGIQRPGRHVAGGR